MSDLSTESPSTRITRLEAEIVRLRSALQLITLHGCSCSPEREIDPEERECAACIAEGTLG